MKVAIVGAAGLVGEMFLRVMEERGFPASDIIPYGTSHSAGKMVSFGDQIYQIKDLGRSGVEECGLALFSAGAEASKAWAPKFRDKGALVVDNSSAFRNDPEVPLVVPEVNPEAVHNHRGLIANPNCSTIGMVTALYPLHRRFGLSGVVVTSFQSVSGAGRRAVMELEEQNSRASAPAAIFPRKIAGNCIPQIGGFFSDGETSEERKFRDEGRKIMGIPNLKVSATAVRAPITVGHSLSIHAWFETDVCAENAVDALSQAPGLQVFPSPEDYPTPADAAGQDAVLVGRIRNPEGFENSLNLWIALDNTRKGAATNAVQIAEIALLGGKG